MASVEVMQLRELADVFPLCSEIASLTESTEFRKHLFTPYVARNTCFALCTPRVCTQQFSARFLHLHFQFRLIVLFLVVPCLPLLDQPSKSKGGGRGYVLQPCVGTWNTVGAAEQPWLINSFNEDYI